jgi:DNA-binding MarR family transcriptional regulator
MLKFELDEQERQVLQALARGGAMSPSQVSAETLILPGDTAKLLQMLADVGLVLMRDDSDSADGKLVALSAQARDLLNVNRAAQMQIKR